MAKLKKGVVGLGVTPCVTRYPSPDLKVEVSRAIR